MTAWFDAPRPRAVGYDEDGSEHSSDQDQSGHDYGNQFDQTVAVDLAMVSDNKTGSISEMGNLLMPDHLDREIFDMALPYNAPFAPNSSTGASPTVAQWASGLHGPGYLSAAPAPHLPVHERLVPSAAELQAPSASDTPPCDAATEALLGFACHALRLAACEYWHQPASSNGEPVHLLTHLASVDPNGLS